MRVNVDSKVDGFPKALRDKHLNVEMCSFKEEAYGDEHRKVLRGRRDRKGWSYGLGPSLQPP